MSSKKQNPIRTLREQEGITQLQLAERSGLSLGTVNIAERSGRITKYVADNIAKGLKVKPEALKGIVR